MDTAWTHSQHIYFITKNGNKIINNKTQQNITIKFHVP